MWFKSDIFGLFPITLAISTIKGDSNIPFYKELGLKATEVPMVAFSVDEEGLRDIDD